MKCLPANKSTLLASGTVLHDWHAEILAIRAFNLFLMQESRALIASTHNTSLILRRKEAHEISAILGLQPFTIQEGLKIFMYCSEAPCGDASMELVMEAQEDATPWPPSEYEKEYLFGRGSFSQLGVVRRKPLSPVNVYINTLILPHSQYRQEACKRAFGLTGRMKPLADRNWPAGYAFRPFQVKTTDLDFEHSRRAANATGSKGCNVSAVWIPGHRETLINGVLQGRKQTDPKGASALSQTEMWNLLLKTIAIVERLAFDEGLDLSSYSMLKQSKSLLDRQKIKDDVRREALKGWVRNVVSDSSGL
ncbi:hypothetical protein MMC28_007692 [Mycoblastus sanguinarius]|nr:hypothetical protein [Mycoblastus sanguinarius]